MPAYSEGETARSCRWRRPLGQDLRGGQRPAPCGGMTPSIAEILPCPTIGGQSPPTGHLGTVQETRPLGQVTAYGQFEWIKIMALNFPNPSRSLDASNNRVRFWAYDSAMEVSFFIGVEALRKLTPEMGCTESQILKVFDATRERIHEIASNVYARGRQGTYTCTLAVDDF